LIARLRVIVVKRVVCGQTFGSSSDEEVIVA
jgi:hypothetical protein